LFSSSHLWLRPATADCSAAGAESVISPSTSRPTWWSKTRTEWAPSCWRERRSRGAPMPRARSQPPDLGPVPEWAPPAGVARSSPSRAPGTLTVDGVSRRVTGAALGLARGARGRGHVLGARACHDGAVKRPQRRVRRNFQGDDRRAREQSRLPIARVRANRRAESLSEARLGAPERPPVLFSATLSL
jgi:hypothetical protein